MRREKRVSYWYMIMGKGERNFVASGIDLSRNGIAFETSEPLDVGEEIELVFPSVSDFDTKVKVLGKVVRKHRVDDNYYMYGVSFVYLIPKNAVYNN